MRIFYNQSVDAIARRLIPGIAVVALAAWGVASGGAVLEDVPELTSKAQAANLGSGSAGAAADAGSWQDGTWTGTAQGYGGDVTVSVTIANKKITAIEVVSASGETPSFFSRAKAIIPKIIEAQNPDVDVVSGATYSSNGIINAVKNALTKASGGTVTETSNGGAARNAAGSTSSDAFQDGTYKDGTYTGSAAGFRGNITVSVTISGGKIASISVVSAPGNDEPYLSKAKTLIAKVLAKQSPNGVDTVSGATYSSNGILNAIKNALTKAAGGTVSETPSSGGTTGGDTSPSKLDKDTYTGTYKDGTYTGTGKGYKGTVTAKVTISGGKIKTIDVSGSDDAAYFSKAKNGIVNKIISGQSTNVDTVSGATYSSNGIISAVRNALKKAQTTGGTTTDDEYSDAGNGHALLFTEVLIEGTDQNIIFHSGGAHQQQTIHGRHHGSGQCGQYQTAQYQTAQDRRQQTVDHHKYGLIRGGQIGEQNLAAQADDDDADFDNTDDTHNHGKAAFLLLRAFQGVEALDVVRGTQRTKEVVHLPGDDK